MDLNPVIIAPSSATAKKLSNTGHPGAGVLSDIAFGSIAGIAGKFIEYPFDTIKVRLQTQPAFLPARYNGAIDCFRKSVKSDGFLSLYRGISVPVLGASAEASSLFLFENLGREAIYAAGVGSRDRELPLAALWFTGGFSGFFASFVMTPLELLKCKIQAPRFHNGVVVSSLKPIQVIQEVYRQTGLRGFWHGQMGTLIRETGGSAAWFGAKETFSAFFRDRRGRLARTDSERQKLSLQPLPIWQQLIAGASAGVSYNFLCFPADTTKSRMQTSVSNGNRYRRTFWEEGHTLWKQQGMRGMYRGCGITCLRAAPASAFIFLVYDGLKSFFST